MRGTGAASHGPDSGQQLRADYKRQRPGTHALRWFRDHERVVNKLNASKFMAAAASCLIDEGSDWVLWDRIIASHRQAVEEEMHNELFVENGFQSRALIEALTF